MKNFLAKYEWVYSNSFIHGLIAYLLTGKIWAIIITIIIDLDHIRFTRTFWSWPNLKKRMFGTSHTQGDAHQKGDIFHKIPILIISAIAIVLPGVNEIIFTISVAIFTHLFQDFFEDYYFDEDISGWNY